MSSRLAACEACRKSKLACDHKRPACTRCQSSGRGGICIYRVSPFKRKRVPGAPTPVTQNPPGGSPDSPPSPFSPRPTLYPNPGYLGSSSHTTIFDHISVDRSSFPGDRDVPDIALSKTPYPQLADDNSLLQGASALRQLLNEFQLTAMRDVVTFWLAKGANLALAEPLVEACTESIMDLFTIVSQDESWHLSCASLLLQNSTQPLKCNSSSTFSEFLAQLLGPKFRWEALGIFFLAVSRATVDISFFPPLYMTKEKRYFLRKLATKLSDYALEICLSLDCLNDIQLVLQYENFIMHSFVDGDHSYHSWRKLGDVISSIFALGYHEDIDSKADAPFFLKQLRKTAFARIYSADKNVAIFLGRPPRVTKRFCLFQIPLASAALQDYPESWDVNDKASYRAETRWSALCASLKEEILEMARDKHPNSCTQRISAIQNAAEAQWRNLPLRLRLEGEFKQRDTNSPFEQDFLISVRLNHLHVHFLLQLLLLNTLVDPDISLVTIAGEMLSRVVEAILIRDQTINSGTSLIWKIAHYGLPAAGIVVLAILKQRNAPMNTGTLRTKALQDLSIFVAEIQKGSIVMKGDPIYALLSKATQTIQRLLDSFYLGIARDTLEGISAGQNRIDDWASILDRDLWDFETFFWESLAGHPSLVTPETTLSGL